MSGDDTRRRPVWHAMSELFLDTELMEEDYRRIARILLRSGYTAERLRQILEEEVAPAFASNLLSSAGGWAPWEEEEVAQIMSRSRRTAKPGRWLWRRLVRRHVTEEWGRIAPLLSEVETAAS